MPNHNQHYEEMPFDTAHSHAEALKKALEESQGGVGESDAINPVNLPPSASLVTMSQHCDVVVGGAEQGPGINIDAAFVITGNKKNRLTNEALRVFAIDTYNVDLKTMKEAISRFDVHNVVKEYSHSSERGLSGILFRPPPAPA